MSWLKGLIERINGWRGKQEVGGYLAYMKVLGLSTKKAEEAPHVDFNWGRDGDKFEVYGTCWLKNNKPSVAQIYVWNAGPFDIADELCSRLTKMGYVVSKADISIMHYQGNGHFYIEFK